MSDAALRQELIKLAHGHENLRKDILPLVAEPEAKKAAQRLMLRQVKSLMRQCNLPGELKGRGTDWEVEVPNERATKAWHRVIKGLGGYKTGYGSWVLRQDYQSKGEWSDPSSRHHYGADSAKVTSEVKKLLTDLKKAKLDGLGSADALKWVLDKKKFGELGMALLTLRDDLKDKSFLKRHVSGDYDAKAIPGLVRRLESLAKQRSGSLTLRREARLASMFTADMKLSYGEQLKLMQANPPKMGKGTGYWYVEIYSPFIKKYMGVAEWTDEKAAKADLAVWKKAHKDTIGKLKTLAAKEGKQASTEHEARAGVPSALKYITRGDTKLVSEGTNIRVYMGRGSIYIIEIPQKPLKRRKVRVLSLQDTTPPQLPGWDWFLPVNLLKGSKGAKIGKNDTYDQALKKLQGALAAAEKEVEKVWAENPPTKAKSPDPWFPSIQQDEANYLLIEPSDTKPMTVKAKDFTVKSNWLNFESYSPGTDWQDQEPSYTKYEAKSPAAARKFYKILKADPDALKQVPWNKFGEWLTKHKIPVNLQFSQWR